MTAAAPRALVCAECGAAFTCTGDAACWCAGEPYRLPMPDSEAAGDCLCPACLRRRAEQAAPPARSVIALSHDPREDEACPPPARPPST